MRPTPAIALGAVHERLAPLGLNLVGITSAEGFDKTQPSGRRVRELMPTCGTILVVGSGGRDFWQKMLSDLGEPVRDPQASYRPIEDRCARSSRELVEWLAEAGVVARAVCAQRTPSLNFAQLAEMAGLGVVSPVSEWLIHPQYGPWVSVRYALLLEGMPFGTAFTRSLAGEYQPCAGCDQPCVRACPAHVCSGGSIERGRCATWRHDGGCESGCEMKRACPRGADHRFDAEEERFRHAYALFDLQREYGLGIWRFVPRRLRERRDWW
ncbi:MAG TPA: hypothetical protein VK081_13185 [Planctomycetota bacterium]|nr:hypothetical protein [Planctomycetota bacterium]